MEDKFKIKKPKNWLKMSFHKKIQYIMKILTIDFSPYVDKINAKDIVKKICPDINHSLNIAKIIKIINKPDDFTKDNININHIIKSSHACRWNIIMNINSNVNEIQKLLKSYNKKYKPNIEKQYSFIKPQFFIEEIIEDKYYGKSGNAISYGFYCLYGKIQFIRIDDPLCGKVNTLDKNWNLISNNYMNRDFEIPKNYHNIVNMVSLLSSQFEFVRIDLFIAVNDEIYFSEFTFTPNGGKQYITPIDYAFVDEWI